MESAIVATVRAEWISATDEYLQSKAQGLQRFEPEQLARLREALVILVQVTPELGIFEAKRLSGSVDAAILRLNRTSPTIAEWLQEAARHHVHAVVKIRDAHRKRFPAVREPPAPLPVPDPRELLDTKDDTRPTIPVPAPNPRELTPSMLSEADDFADGIEDIYEEEAYEESEAPPIVIDIDEPPAKKR